VDNFSSNEPSRGLVLLAAVGCCWLRLAAPGAADEMVSPHRELLVEVRTRRSKCRGGQAVSW
jgi:hypothetical protein